MKSIKITFIILLSIIILPLSQYGFEDEDQVIPVVEPDKTMTKLFKMKLRFLGGIGSSSFSMNSIDSNYHQNNFKYGGMGQVLFGMGTFLSLGFEAGVQHISTTKHLTNSRIFSKYDILQMGGVMEIYLSREIYLSMGIGGTIDLGVYGSQTSADQKIAESFAYMLSLGGDIYFADHFFVPVVVRVDIYSVDNPIGGKRGYIVSGGFFTGIGMEL